MSIAELRYVTLTRVVVSLAIGAMVTLGSFGFTRSGRIGCPPVLLLLVEQVHLIRARVERFGIRGEDGETRKFYMTTMNMNMSKRIQRLKVVNHIVAARRKSHEKVACFVFIVP